MERAGQTNQDVKAQRLAAFYNMVPNVAWSVLNIGPLFVFCYAYMEVSFGIIACILSVAAMFVPRAFLDRLLPSSNPSFYKRLGVHWLNRFTQNGAIINRLVQKRYPAYSSVSNTRKSVRQLLARTYLQERFHFGLLLFFLATGVYAVYKDHWVWSTGLFLANIFYNVYPILLQQYTRIRITKFCGTDKFSPGRIL